MKLAKILLISPVIAVSVALFAALSSFATTYEASTIDALAAAVGAAGDGDEIVIKSPFTKLTGACTLEIANAVTIRGETDSPADTVIDAGGKALWFRLANAKAIIKNLTINNANPPTTDQGTIEIQAAGGIVSNCVLKTGGAKGPSALRLLGGRATECVLNSCSSRDSYGFVHVNGEGAMFDHSIVRGGSITSGGSSTVKGAVCLTKGTVSDCLISNNKIYTQYGAGVYIDGDDAILRNCTIIGNKPVDSKDKASTGAGGIYWPQKTGARIVNNIIAGNGLADSTDPEIKKSGTAQDASLPDVFLNNCVLGLDIGTACQTVDSVDDVKFTDAAAGDYNLLRGSPAIDHGTDAQGLSAKDLAGNVRAMGDRVDIGAYEYNPMEVDFESEVTTGNHTTVFPLKNRSIGFSENATYEWTVSEDSGACDPVTSTDKDFDFSSETIGAYTVKLVVTDGAVVMEKTRPAYLKVLAYACDFTMDATEGIVGAEFHFTSIVEGISEGVAYKWTFKNETTGASSQSTEQNPTFTADAIGQITVTLEVESELGKISKTKENVVTVQTDVTYVDPDNAENAEFPYDSWETAATTLADAYAAVGPGGEIILAEKTIGLPDILTNGKGVTIRGKSSDRERTVLSFTNGKRIELDHAKAALRDLTITGGNGNTELQGRVKILSNGGLVSNCVIKTASSGTKGPTDVAMVNGRVTACEFYGSGTRDTVGSIYMDGIDAQVDHCIIRNMSHGSGGGLTYGTVYVKQGTLSDCLIANCKADTSANGIVTLGSGNAVVRNCTIVGNEATRSGSAGSGGIYVPNATGARVVNCIVAGNSSTTAANANLLKASQLTDAALAQIFLNNCIQGWEIGTGFAPAATLEDVKFVKVESGKVVDFNLQSASPAFDAGTDALGLSETDLAGRDRVMGKAVDMGAYEYEIGDLACDFDVDRTEGVLGTQFRLTSQVFGADVVSYKWTFTNSVTGSVTGSTEQNPVFTAMELGKIGVTLEIDAGSGKAAKTKDECFSVLPVSTFVDPANGENAKFPYDSWETAATTLADAYAATVAGGTVILAETTIPFAETLVNDRGITIRGNSPDRTKSVLSFENGKRIELNHAASAIRDLTIRDGNGETEWQGRVKILSNGGLVSNCVFAATTYGAKGPTDIVLYNGLAIDCQFADSSTRDSCGSVYLAGESARVERCSIRNMGQGLGGQMVYGTVYVEKGLLSDCLIADCKSNSELGIVTIGSSQAVVRNCTIVGNEDLATGAGLYWPIEAPGARVINTIVAGNVSAKGTSPEIKMNGSSGKLSEVFLSNCVLGLDIGSSCLQVETLEEIGFVKMEDGKVTDFRLARTSPAVDVGTEDAGISEKDLACNARKIGPKVDIGAYECTQRGFMLLVR